MLVELLVRSVLLVLEVGEMESPRMPWRAVLPMGHCMLGRSGISPSLYSQEVVSSEQHVLPLPQPGIIVVHSSQYLTFPLRLTNRRTVLNAIFRRPFMLDTVFKVFSPVTYPGVIIPGCFPGGGDVLFVFDDAH